MPIGDFLGGLLNGFGQTSLYMQQQKKDQEERKARVKLYEIQLEREQQAVKQQQQLAELRNQYFGQPDDGTMGGLAIPAQGAIGTRDELQQNPALLDRLASGRVNQYLKEAALLTGDIGALSKLDEQERATQFQNAVLEQMQSGGMGGMQPSGMTFSSGGQPSFSFQSPEFRYIETPQGQIPYDPQNPPGVLPNKPNIQRVERPGPNGTKIVEFVDVANPGLPTDPSQVNFGGGMITSPYQMGGNEQMITSPAPAASGNVGMITRPVPGGGIVTELGYMDTPMDATEASKYLSTDGIPAKAGMTPRQAQENGFQNRLRDAGSKPPAEIERMNIAMGALNAGLDSYEAYLRDNFDPRNPKDMLDPTKLAELQSIVADLRLQAKEAQALGALTGPDMDILDKILTDPASTKGALFGKTGLQKQIKQARLGIKRRADEIARMYPATAGKSSGAEDPLGIR